MKNTIKMSLVAALAVAGLSSTASAGSLEEAIKGVDISGKMEVEYDYSDNNLSQTATVKDNTDNSWDYDLDIKAKIPVNDMVTAVVGLQADQEVADETAIQTDDGADSGVENTSLFFQYANGPVTATIGKQGLGATPWFDDESGAGAIAMYNAGVATLVGAHFTNTKSSPLATVNGAAAAATSLQAADITALAAIGKVGPVNASVWYANLAGIAGGIDADSYSINVNGSFDIVNLDVTYTDTDYDYASTITSDNKDADLLKVVASVALDQATIYAGYGETGKDNADSLAGVDLTGDNDANVNFKSEQLSIDELNDAEAWLIGATIPVGALTLDVSYLDGDFKHDSQSIADYDTGYPGTDKTSGSSADFNEFLVQADYAMSKNFKIGAHYSWAEISQAELDAASISLEYKF